MPPNTVKVDRSTKWGNPYAPGVSLPGGASNPADAFRYYVGHTVEGARLADLARVELCGKNLACWCRPDQPCHADVLLGIANETMTSDGGSRSQ